MATRISFSAKQFAQIKYKLTKYPVVMVARWAGINYDMSRRTVERIKAANSYNHYIAQRKAESDKQRLKKSKKTRHIHGDTGLLLMGIAVLIIVVFLTWIALGGSI